MDPRNHPAAPLNSSNRPSTGPRIPGLPDRRQSHRCHLLQLVPDMGHTPTCRPTSGSEDGLLWLKPPTWTKPPIWTKPRSSQMHHYIQGPNVHVSQLLLDGPSPMLEQKYQERWPVTVNRSRHLGTLAWDSRTDPPLLVTLPVPDMTASSHLRDLLVCQTYRAASPVQGALQTS